MPARAITYAERAPFYDREYVETGDQAFLSSLITEGVHSVLEVPCGAGRITLRLARAGLRWVAVDIEPAMIRRLKDRLAEAHLDEVEGIVGDMRNLELGERFPLIIVQREAFQLADRDHALSVLRTLRRHLSPEGVLVIDLAAFVPGHADEASLQPAYFDPSLPDGVEVEDWREELPGGAGLRRSRIQHRTGDSIRVTYHYRVRRADGAEEQWEMELPLAVYSREAFLDLAARAGLRSVHIYRDYERRPHAPGAVRMVCLLTHAPATADLVGWIKEAGAGFVNDHDGLVLDSAGLADQRLRPDRVAYFRSYLELYFREAFIAGQGTEEILATLSRFGRGGRWLDLGAGTTTLFWSIPLSGISSVGCADIAAEALLVLDEFVRSGEVPGCYRDALSMLGRTEAQLHEVRRRFGRYYVFDALTRWPARLRDERFDLITAFGNFGMAADADRYRACFGELAGHLAAGGRAVGADWVRTRSFAERDGHDNSYLGRALVARAAEVAGLRVLACRPVPIAGDGHYESVLVWAMEKP